MPSGFFDFLLLSLFLCPFLDPGQGNLKAHDLYSQEVIRIIQEPS